MFLIYLFFYFANYGNFVASGVGQCAAASVGSTSVTSCFALQHRLSSPLLHPTG